MSGRGPSAAHLLLAATVAAVWGTNFVVMKAALAHLPPLFFASLRFMLVVFPAILVLRRPPVPWRDLAQYGLLIGAGQFGLLFSALDGHITPGLASLVIQTQAPLTIVLAAIFSGERIRAHHVAALALAGAGIAIILFHVDATTTPLGLAMVLGAASCWAAGNLVGRRNTNIDMLAFMVWSSLFAAPPLFALSLAKEGWPAMAAALAHAGAADWAAVVWQAVGNTMFGYAAWAWLLARNSAASITPMALLVPVFGMLTSAFWFGEPLQGWKLAAAALVLAGLALNVLWPRLASWRGLDGGRSGAP